VGFEELIGMIDKQLPNPQVDVKVTVPFDRGDLVARMYREGLVLSRTETQDGTILVAKVPQPLANVLMAL
jgi:GTP-binding protein HflX